MRRVAALVLFALGAVYALEQAIISPLQRFDEGILLNSVSFLASGLVPVGDAYQPYGPGYGLPGLPGQLAFGSEALVTRAPYLLAPTIVVVLAFYWLYPRVGLWLAGGAALLISLAEIPRYSLAWICVFCFLIAIDRAIRGCSVPTLDAALNEHPRAVAVAGALLGAAGWFRMEYGVFAVVWIATVIVVTRRRPPPVAVLPALAVALSPIAVVIAAGGLRHFSWWLEYALSGFREFRAQPFNASAPLDFARVFFGGAGRTEYALETFSYFAGGLIVAAAAFNALLARRWRFIDRDATGLTGFLLAIGAIVLYAQSVRFFGEQGYSAMPLLWAAFAASSFRSALIKPLVIAGALLALAPGLLSRLDIPAEIDNARAAYRQSGSSASVQGLRRVPLNNEERSALPALLSLWKRQQPMPSHAFVINRRNDDAQANEAFAYWFLDVKPAAWPATFDPGLADRDDVQREAVADLCAKRAPLIQAAGSYTGSKPQGRSDVLDRFVAFGYDVVAATPMHRILRRRSERCRRPQDATVAELRRRRDALLAAAELPEAGVLSQALIARDRAQGRPVAPADLALASLARRDVDARLARDAELRGLLAALAADDGSFGYDRVAADRRAAPLVRLAAIAGYVRAGRLPPRPDADSAIAGAALELASSDPRYAAAGEAITAIVPADPVLFARLRAAGVHAEWLTSWQFTHAVATRDVPAALRHGRRLLDSAPVRPLQQAAVLTSIAGLLTRAQDVACGEALRGVADALRGARAPDDRAADGCGDSDLRRLIERGTDAAARPI